MKKQINYAKLIKHSDIYTFGEYNYLSTSNTSFPFNDYELTRILKEAFVPLRDFHSNDLFKNIKVHNRSIRDIAESFFNAIKEYNAYEKGILELNKDKEKSNRYKYYMTYTLLPDCYNSVCLMPLQSVMLLYEICKDYYTSIMHFLAAIIDKNYLFFEHGMYSRSPDLYEDLNSDYNEVDRYRFDFHNKYFDLFQKELVVFRNEYSINKIIPERKPENKIEEEIYKWLISGYEFITKDFSVNFHDCVQLGLSQFEKNINPEEYYNGEFNPVNLEEVMGMTLLFDSDIADHSLPYINELSGNYGNAIPYVEDKYNIKESSIGEGLDEVNFLNDLSDLIESFMDIARIIEPHIGKVKSTKQIRYEYKI